MTNVRGEGWVMFGRVLRDHGRATLLWTASLGAITVFYLAFWPSMGEEMRAAIDGMPAGLIAALGYDRIGTAAGYLAAVVYGLLAPGTLLVFGIALAGRSIAGQEEDGTLELEFASPRSRGAVYWQRYAASWLLLVTPIVGVTLSVWIADPWFGLGLSWGNVAAASLGLSWLVGGYATIAFAVGAATGRRGAALAVAGGAAVVGYVFRGVANAAGVPLLADLSPFAWFLAPDPLMEGFGGWGWLRLLAISALAAPAGWWAFLRRDLGR